MQTPQAWIFIWIVCSRETFPLFKCCTMEPGRTQVLIEKNIPVIDDAPRCSERGHFQIPLSVWVQMRVELEGKYVFWISERAVFSVRACLLHSCAITVRLLVASGKAAQTAKAKIERLGASTCRRYLAFTDRTSSLCAVCLADGMWSLTWFTSPKLGIPAKGGKMEHLLDVWPNSGIKISAHL